jgi:hypothetical protein
VPPGGGRINVVIPSLAAETAPVAPATAQGPAAPAPAPVPAGASARKPVGLAAIGIGAGGLLAGAIAGGLAIKKHGDLAAVCDQQGGCNGQQSAIDSYHLLTTVSDVGLVVGGALAVTGIVLVATAPKATAVRNARIVPVVGPGFAGMAGRF